MDEQRRDDEKQHETDAGLPWDILDGYFAGTSTPADQARIEAWMAEASERPLEIEFLRSVWSQAEEVSGRNEPQWDTQQAVIALSQRVQNERSRPIRIGTSRQRER